METTLEKQVFSYTVLTFNSVLKRIVNFAPDWNDQDKETIVKELIKLYMVWDAAWKKGHLQNSNKVKRFVKLFKESGILLHLQPLATAIDKAEELWKLAQSPSFLQALYSLVVKL